MAHYYQTESRETYCEVCGYVTLCDVLAADYRESETGYLGSMRHCSLCIPILLFATSTASQQPTTSPPPDSKSG
jgi:hypothetical protein